MPLGVGNIGYWKFLRKVTRLFSFERDPLCPFENDPPILIQVS